VTGKAVIDLACGERYYTRALRRQGAAQVVGVDLSRAMIGLAEAEEARRPLGIEYRVGDVRTLEAPEEFDLAVAAYLLNYAHTAEELTQMCRAVARGSTCRGGGCPWCWRDWPCWSRPGWSCCGRG
jgi:2-polyprenyl-3-methyl-5-hydroxy-6-metoxy-1,4-benzoquinol methylase